MLRGYSLCQAFSEPGHLAHQTSCLLSFVLMWILKTGAQERHQRLVGRLCCSYFSLCKEICQTGWFLGNPRQVARSARAHLPSPKATSAATVGITTWWSGFWNTNPVGWSLIKVPIEGATRPPSTFKSVDCRCKHMHCVYMCVHACFRGYVLGAPTEI